MPNFDDAAVQAASSKRAEKPATEFRRGLNVMFLIDLISEANQIIADTTGNDNSRAIRVSWRRRKRRNLALPGKLENQSTKLRRRL
jgi:hypothetical protein